jgi:hypothetical protein
MILAISAANYYLSGVGKRDAAVLALVPLDIYGEKSAIINLLPLIHAGIQPAHGRILEVNEITLIHV